jgi:hypothetical protein
MTNATARISPRALLLPLAALLAAAPLHAQVVDYRGSAGWYAGALRVGALNPGAGEVTVDGERRRAAAIEPGWGWVAGVQAEHWYGAGFAGYRVHGAFGRQSVPWADRHREVNVWLGDVALVLRPLGAGAAVAPFLAAGAGGILFGLGTGDPIFHPAADARYDGRQRVRWGAVLGGGVDVVSPWTFDHAPVVFRLEAADHWLFQGPFTRLDGGALGAVHNLRLSVGLHAGIGTIPVRSAVAHD